MTRSLYVLGAAALAYSGTAVAAEEKTYQLADSFNSENFFDNFDFFESKFGTGNYNDVDPTSGYVNYRSRADAEYLGLIATQGTEMYIGVDHANTLDPQGQGRNSVRLESKKVFNSGLIIAKFSHLPAPVCGTWPGFWMYGANWPTNGEIDIYENWNNAPNNLLTLHTASDAGSCKLAQSEMSDPIVTGNCDNNAAGQYTNQGCGATEVNGLWGSASGGVCKFTFTLSSP
jgi:beta-glucanase (GH16 family)